MGIFRRIRADMPAAITTITNEFSSDFTRRVAPAMTGLITA